MRIQTLFTFVLILLFNPAHAIASPDGVLIIDFGDEFKEDTQTILDIFKGCGISAKRRTVSTIEDIPMVASDSSLGPYVFVEAHGDYGYFTPDGHEPDLMGRSDSEMDLFVGGNTMPLGIGGDTSRSLSVASPSSSKERNKKFIRSKMLLRALRSGIPELQVWFDTCHAGACLENAPVCGVGASCTRGQRTWGAEKSRLIAHLLCSAKTDCRLWQKHDANGDGSISGNELSRMFDKAAKPLPRKHMVRVEKTDAKGLKEARDFCDSVKGKITEKEKKPVTMLSSEGEKTYTFIELLCTYTLKSLAVDQLGKPVDMVQSPQTGSFRLSAPQCATEAHSKTSRPSSHR